MMERIWWRIEWAFWQKLVPFKVQRRLAYYVCKLIARRQGMDMAQYWTWSMTPYPAACPFMYQLWRGLELAFARSKERVDAIIKRNEREIDEAMDSIHKRKKG